MPTADLLTVDATHRFGPTVALDHIHLRVPAGSRHAVIGPNGAGKTTLLNLIAGTLQPTHGHIHLDGRDITRLPTHRRARLGVARTWQHPAICRDLTVAQNIALAVPSATARRHGLTPHLTRAGLHGLDRTPAGHLSYGQRRQLEVAIALAAQPRLLLMDEPSAGLAPADIATLIQTVDALGAEVTVVFTDHNLDVVAALATDVTVLDHGKQLETGPATHVLPATPTPTQPSRPVPPAPAGRPPRKPALQTSGLAVGYPGTASVLTDVNLTLHHGEIIAITGTNGAGKTTLLHTLAGLLPPHRGHIRLASHDLTHTPAHHRARAGLSLVQHSGRSWADLTVAQHLRLPTPPPAALTPPDPRAVLNLLPTLRSRLRQPAATLSGGEQKQLMLAQALLTQPAVLLLDEPFDGLSTQTATAVRHILHTLATNGTAILLTDPNPNPLPDLAHHVAAAHAGRLTMIDSDTAGVEP
jgi:branched-chain amino acid transport system ATP-binding protein